MVLFTEIPLSPDFFFVSFARSESKELTHSSVHSCIGRRVDCEISKTHLRRGLVRACFRWEAHPSRRAIRVLLVGLEALVSSRAVTSFDQPPF